MTILGGSGKSASITLRRSSITTIQQEIVPRSERRTRPASASVDSEFQTDGRSPRQTVNFLLNDCGICVDKRTARATAGCQVSLVRTCPDRLVSSYRAGALSLMSGLERGLLASRLGKSFMRGITRDAPSVFPRILPGPDRPGSVAWKCL